MAQPYPLPQYDRERLDTVPLPDAYYQQRKVPAAMLYLDDEVAAARSEGLRPGASVWGLVREVAVAGEQVQVPGNGPSLMYQEHWRGFLRRRLTPAQLEMVQGWELDHGKPTLAAVVKPAARPGFDQSQYWVFTFDPATNVPGRRALTQDAQAAGKSALVLQIPEGSSARVGISRLYVALDEEGELQPRTFKAISGDPRAMPVCFDLDPRTGGLTITRSSVLGGPNAYRYPSWSDPAIAPIEVSYADRHTERSWFRRLVSHYVVAPLVSFIERPDVSAYRRQYDADMWEINNEKDATGWLNDAPNAGGKVIPIHRPAHRGRSDNWML